jgi:adenosylmethionine-8-amino-7-oxononanoate aminotransferase
MRDFDASQRTFVRGRGATLWDASGRSVFDAVSSIWTTIHGHCRAEIVEAIARQAALLDHATALGATNLPAESLAAALCRLTGMEYAFFGSDGASAIEAALKMALQYWQNCGQPRRTRFVRMVDGYHGDTAGAMSVSDIALFRERFGAITFETATYGNRAELDADDIAAVIVEPLIHAAAGMRAVPASAYAAFAGIAPLVIIDEIATGFGRTGTMFAFEQTALVPDLLCLGKGISSGTLALSATMTTKRVYDAFLGAHADAKQFFHGHSYAGNPIACAAALASLDVFRSDDTLVHVAALATRARERLAKVRASDAIAATRQVGLMIGIDLDVAHLEARGARTPAWRVADGLYRRGHFTRPIGETIQLVPPLSSSLDELDAFFDALGAELQS